MSQVSTRQRTAWQRATTQPRHQTSSKFIKGHQTVSSKFIKPYEFSIEILCYGRQAFEIGGACPSLTTPQLGVWCFPESLNRKMSQLPPGGRHIFLPCRFLVYRIVEPQEAGEQWFELDWNKSFAARADKVATLYLCRSQWHHMISWKCRKLQKVPIGSVYFKIQNSLPRGECWMVTNLEHCLTKTQIGLSKTSTKQDSKDWRASLTQSLSSLSCPASSRS